MQLTAEWNAKTPKVGMVMAEVAAATAPPAVLAASAATSPVCAPHNARSGLTILLK